MKNVILFSIILIFSIMNSNSQSFFNSETPFAHTFSIVARDSVTGDIGVAVQSHWFNVGAIVTWGEAGVGVVATQSFVNPSFGLRGLELLKQGKSPQEAIDELIASDDGRDVRQLAILDTKGRSASYTGKNCIYAAGNIAMNNFSVQANLMLNDKVWPAMSEAFQNTKGPLAERMIAALEAGQNAGGDIRGRQSASILIYKGVSSGEPWNDKLMDLRVEDNDQPIKELKRLVEVQRAYDHMNNGDLATEKNNMKLAMDEYNTAMKMFPDNLEMKYWTAVTLANNNRVDEALPMFKEVFEKDKNWLELTPRLPKSQLLTVSDSDLQRILNVK